MRILAIGSLAVIVVAAIAFYVLAPKQPQQQAPAGSGAPVTLPSAGETTVTVGNSGATFAPGEPNMSLTLATGSTTVVKDFITSSTTGKDVQNPGVYYLAGSAGYCLADGTCPHGAAVSDFIITYDSSSEFFTISLTEEPLATARADAEQFLATTLGLSDMQLCDLKYTVLTNESVNAFFAGKNLGFSSCPGATVLPQ